MFKLSNLISRNRNTKAKDTLTPDQLANLSVFSQNLNLLNTISTQDEKVRLFETILSQFKSTFNSICYDQLHNPQVVESLEKYCLICANVGSSIVTNINESKDMFDSLLFIYHMLSYLPYDTEFINLFFVVIHEAKRSPELLNPAYDVITLIFNSQRFYNLFVENDGYTLIFTNFYIHCISPESQKFFNVLFFESIPKDFHTQIPPQSLISLFVEVFSKDDIEQPLPPCAAFVVNYLTTFHHSTDPTLFERFNDLNGFSALNGYFLKHCQTEESVSLYKKLLIESQTAPLIVTSLYKMYRDKSAKPSFRTCIINLIALSLNNVFSFEKFNLVAPIHLWILFPPELDREGLIMLTIFLKDLSEKRLCSIKPALDSILKLIQPPGNEIAPIDSLLELIETAIAQHELKPSELLSKKFLEDFILIPSVEEVGKYFEDHVLFGSVVVSVYSSEMTADYRYPVIQKFIESSQYLKNLDDFIQFLETLFTRHFGAETVSLLLSFLNNDQLVNLLVKELRKRNLGYHYFMESNGLLSLEDFLIDENNDEEKDENSDIKKGEKVVNILAAISCFGPKEEINEWINEQPLNSPIFKCERSFLQKAIYAFKTDTTIIHIASFLPFADDFDPTSMLNLYFAGKFGVRAFKKFNKTIDQIPNYKLISDRFVYPEDIENYLELNEQIIDLSVTHYSVFEFVPNLGKCVLVLPFYSFVYFTFSVPDLPTSPIPLVKINKVFSVVIENNNFVYKNLKNSETSSVELNSNKWHKVVFSYKPLTKKVLLMIDQNKVCTFHIDEEGNQFIFGDEEKPLQSSLLLSTQILVSVKPFLNFDHIWKMSSLAPLNDLITAQVKYSESVYLASYHGFASYFKNFVDLELIFQRIESTQSQQEFKILFDTLLKINAINRIDSNLFYDRLTLSFKRQRDFISDSLVNILYKLPYKYCLKTSRKAKFVHYILSDIELFHLFSTENLIKLIKAIIENLNDSIDSINSSLLLQNVICLIRSGLDQQLILAIIPIISFLITDHPTISKYRFLLNTAVSSCEWNLKNAEFSSFLNNPLPNNKVHYNLLELFIKLAKICPDTELYSYKELLDFMLLFNDERSFLFADLISIYSNRNPKYLSDSSLACFVFSCHCESISCWIRAFAILSGEVAGDIVPTNLVIQRPVFLPVVIDMVSTMCQKAVAASCSHDDDFNEYLIRQILDIILTLPSDNYKYFYQQSCQIPLMILANMGLIPKTIQSPPESYNGTFSSIATLFSPSQMSSKSIRSASLPPINSMSNQESNLNPSSPDSQPKENTHVDSTTSSYSYPNSDKKRLGINWTHFTPSKLSKDDLKSAFSLCDKVSPFSNQIMENETLINFKTQPKYHKQFETLPESIDDIQWCDKLSYRTSLLNLFTNILFQSEPSDFGSDLYDFVVGHALMYDNYSQYFAQELIFTVIIRMTMSDVPLELYHKPMFRLILKCIKSSLFNNRYTHLLSLIFNLMKSLIVKHQFESMLSDPTILNCYQEIILLSFIYVSKDELIELFQLFTTYKSVVFYQPLFDNEDFALYWIHIAHFNKLDNQDVIMCLNLLMSMVDHSIINGYKPEDIDEKWKNFILKNSKSKFESSDYTQRIKRAKSIVTYTTNKLNLASKENLIGHIYRIANFYIQTNSQIFSINSKLRNYEMSFYRMSQDALKFKHQKNFICKSYHLSSNPMPLNQSLAVVPSPFEIKSPEFNQKTSTEFFMSEKEVYPSRIKQVIDDGKMICSPEWHQFNSHESMFSSPFEYSQFINNSSILPMLKVSFIKYGSFITQFNADLFYYTHPIPSVVLVGEKALIVVILSRLVTKSNKKNSFDENQNDDETQENQENQENADNNNEDKINSSNDFDIELIEKPEHPISYVPFAESVTLNEWHKSSLFCGHIVLIFDFERIMSIRPYLYLHMNCALNISSLFDPPLLLIFKNQIESESARKIFNKYFAKSIVNQLPAFPFLVTVSSVQKATEMWGNGLLSNYRYLLLLNHFGGRCFSDLGQYPIFPWVISPNLQTPRNLSLPMGQLDKERSEHYDSTYEDSHKYFYGTHYSQPGIVSWLLLRLPPFIYFQWDLNNGWDNSQRLFVSISDAFASASRTNNMDLKELIPAMYAVPEIFVNCSNLVFSNSANETIALPDWACNSPYHYVEVMLKVLQSSEKLNEWIDLIFGYKQSGEFAVQAKNLFLPTSYHSASPEALDMDPIVFEAQVNNFGQCPIQLFTKPHIARNCKPLTTIVKIDSNKFVIVEKITAKNLAKSISSASSTAKSPYIYPLSSSIILPNAGFQSKQPSSLPPKINPSKTYSSLYLSNITLEGAKKDETPAETREQKASNDQKSVRFAQNNQDQSSPSPQTEEIQKDAQKEVQNEEQKDVQKEDLKEEQKDAQKEDLKESQEDEQKEVDIKKQENEQIMPSLSQTSGNPSNQPNNWYSAVSLLSMISYSHNYYNRSITFCDEGLFVMNGIAESIPPRFSYYVSIDTSLANCQIFSVTEKKSVYLVADPKFVHANHISISANGVFVVISFANGFVQVSRIVHLLKKPSSFEFLTSFWLPMSCNHSVLFSIDFICASLFIANGNRANESNVVYLWNYSTCMLHRIIQPEIRVIRMIADDDQGILTLYGKNDIVQYTINGVKIRSYHTDFDITVCKLYHYSPTFDGNLIVTGDTRGHLTFLNIVDEKNSEKTDEKNPWFSTFTIVGSKAVHKNPIVSMFVSFTRSAIVTIDSRGNSSLTKFNTSCCKVVVNEEKIREKSLDAALFALSKETKIKQSASHGSIDMFQIPAKDAFEIEKENISSDHESIENKHIEKDSDKHVKIVFDNDNLSKKKISPSNSISSVTFALNPLKSPIEATSLRCGICENVASKKCKNCGMPLCSSCINESTRLCPNCDAKSSSLD